MPTLEHRKIGGSTEMWSRLVPDEPRRSLESRPSEGTIEEEEGERQTPSRRGLWDWARSGTGFIGRIPHPEWRAPVFARNRVAVETRDDFSIPSTTATEPDSVMSPSFAQTKQSSDELIANASSTGSPAWQQNVDGSEACTPLKDSLPSTPDTPTPQQRRKAEVPTPHLRSSPGSSDVSAGDTPAKTPAANDTPRSNISAKTSKHAIPTYKIALAPNVLSSARKEAAMT